MWAAASAPKARSIRNTLASRWPPNCWAGPVKWIEDRRENFVATHQERDQYWDMEIAVDKDAKILGLRGRMVHDEGAYLPWGLTVPWISATTVPGPYVIPSFKMEVLVAFTNKISTTPVRGAGRPAASLSWSG